MPQDVTVSVKVEHLRKGDKLPAVNGGGAVETVDQQTPGAQYVKVFVDLGGYVKIRKNEVIDVTRQEPTPTERLARNEEQIASAITAADESVEATAAKVAEYAQYGIDHQWSVMTAHYEGLASRNIWANIKRVGDTRREELGDSLPFVSALIYVADELTRALLDNRFRASSTNALSNVADYMQQKAASEFLRSFLVHDIKANMKAFL